MLSQFYSQRSPPKELLLSHEPYEIELLTHSLSLKSGQGVKLRIPKRGIKHRLVEQAETNARAALERKLGESASRHQLLERLRDLLDLPTFPARIEVFDNSHLQGSQAVGAMIVAGVDGWIKSAYRTFYFDTGVTDTSIRDDVGMMRAMLRRRFARKFEEQSISESTNSTAAADLIRPDSIRPALIVIDGGAEQLKAAHTALSEQGIHDVVALAIAKGRDRKSDHFFDIKLGAFTLEAHDPLLYYLQRLRDEAHRFAIRAHRSRRAKRQVSSRLDQIEGLGAERKRRLLHHFGDVRAIACSGMADLRAVAGISTVLAQRVYRHFHQE